MQEIWQKQGKTDSAQKGGAVTELNAKINRSERRKRNYSYSYGYGYTERNARCTTLQRATHVALTCSTRSGYECECAYEYSLVVAMNADLRGPKPVNGKLHGHGWGPKPTLGLGKCDKRCNQLAEILSELTERLNLAYTL
ncbi:hypothetical protein ACLKA7_004003 [Drosophila subpalustris]